MSSNSTISQELKEELIVQLQQCKTKYTNLMLMSNSLDTEVIECNEHFISCFIQYELLEFALESSNSLSSEITSKYSNRFFIGEKTKESDGWKGIFRFNYCDIIYDHKVNMNAFVVNEKKVYVTLWYLKEEGSETMVKQRKKTDPRIVLIKRCSIE